METRKSVGRWTATVVPLLVAVCVPFLVPSLMKSCRGPRPDPFLAAAEGDDDALARLARATSERERFYALGDAARVAFKRRLHKETERQARELLALAEKYPDNWNYGNAIHEAHLLLGWLKLRSGDIEAAKRHLLEAGRTPGSPQLNSFGPNMSLARGLIERGERDVALTYFELCAVFWERDRGRLEDWADVVRAGELPEFGASLVH